jgi:hypothetical protein
VRVVVKVPSIERGCYPTFHQQLVESLVFAAERAMPGMRFAADSVVTDDVYVDRSTPASRQHRRTLGRGYADGQFVGAASRRTFRPGNSAPAPLDATVLQEEVTATADVAPDRGAKGWNAIAVLEGPSRRVVRERVERDFGSASTWAEHGDVPEVFSFADRIDLRRVEVVGLLLDVDDAVDTRSGR